MAIVIVAVIIVGRIIITITITVTAIGIVTMIGTITEMATERISTTTTSNHPAYHPTQSKSPNPSPTNETKHPSTAPTSMNVQDASHPNPTTKYQPSNPPNYSSPNKVVITKKISTKQSFLPIYTIIAHRLNW
jgi:hypothetical protein